MATKTESSSRSLVRSIAMGVILSMLFMYAVHVLGTWQLEKFRPDPETTSTVQLYNKCAVFGDTHLLRPNADISGMGDKIDGTKLSGSFIIFFDGHIVEIAVISLILGGIIFAIRGGLKKSRHY